MRGKGNRFPLRIEQLNNLVDSAIYSDLHNIIILWGELGKGKSLKKGEKIYTVEDGSVKLIPIEEFKDGSKVICLKDMEAEICTGYSKIKLHHEGDILTIKTKTGRMVKATPDHSFLVYSENIGDFVPKLGKDLRKGDIVPVYRTRSSPTLYSKIRVVDRELELDFDLGFIIGAYLAEGTLTWGKSQKNYAVNIHNHDPVFRQQLCVCLESKGWHAQDRIKNVAISRKELLIFLFENFGKLAGGKRIPPFLLFAPPKFKIGLLSGYFSGDGELSELAILWTTKSEELRRMVALLLGSLGIGSSFSFKKNPKYGTYYKGYVFDRSEFVHLIPIFRTHIELPKKPQEFSTFEKIIPKKSIIENISHKLHLYSRKDKNTRWMIKELKQSMFHDKDITRHGLQGFKRWVIKKGLSEDDEDLKQLDKYIQSQIVFDEVKEILIEHYDGPVYDIETDTGNFMTAEGIFVHNTTLMMRMLYRVLQDWAKVLSFELEPHMCLSCGHTWDANQPYVYEIPCEECNKETKTQSLQEAVDAVYAKKLVIPFPFDYKTGFIQKFPEGTVFSINTGKSRGKVTQKYPYMNFTFHEFRSTLENAVELHIRVPEIGWDDIAVYFHRSNIQYMNPDVKNFFSRYNFVRKYIGNVIITVPSLRFVPLQLMPFCTADVWVNERGAGDFDVKREMRSFWGQTLTWTKSYDGRDVTWDKVPDEWFNAYEEIRHAHAVEAFEHPEEIFVTTMPKKREYTEDESLF